MSKLPITGEYPPDWPEINRLTCEMVGNRCIRCHHPYRKGTHGNGQWTPCDSQCTHAGPLAFLDVIDDTVVPNYVTAIKGTAGNLVIACRARDCDPPYAEWRILTVHHLDGDKSNCKWWNLLPLCQRCHLTVQGNVKPETPYFLEHSAWFRPYVAGFYAMKYEGKDITREEAIARMDELLAHERLA